MLKKIAILLLAAVLLLLGCAATRPDSFRVERSTVIAAPPDRVFALIDDLHGFNRWNPWLRKDPAARGTYSGPERGPGARYAWESNEVGTGSMTVVESAAPSHVGLQLDFIKPFEGHNQATFTLQPEGDGTRVTWAMFGPAPFLSKLMDVVVGMDRMIGPDFEAGLAALKTLAEQR